MALFLFVAVVSGEYAALQADAHVGGDAALYAWAGDRGTRASSSGLSGVFWFGRAGVADDDDDDAEQSGAGHGATTTYAAWLVRFCYSRSKGPKYLTYR